jgi:hypothetical protein
MGREPQICLCFFAGAKAAKSHPGSVQTGVVLQVIAVALKRIGLLLSRLCGCRILLFFPPPSIAIPITNLVIAVKV